MADDIEIVEHDVMDDPAIKNMFPDISVLKQEIKIFEEGIHESEKREASESKHIEPVNEDIKCSKGSNNTTDVVTIELDDPDEPVISSKIILGSKPNKPLQYEEKFFEEQVKSYDVNVVLDDLKPYLNMSGRFCSDCLILFPSKSALDCHIKIYHNLAKSSSSSNTKSDKVFRKRFKCGKCSALFGTASNLCKHNKIYHTGMAQLQRIKEMISHAKKGIRNKNEIKPNDYKCFHCTKLYPTQKSLIDHLYSTIIQRKNYICKICSQSFKNNKELNQHIILSHRKCFVSLKKVADHLSDKTDETSNKTNQIQPVDISNKTRSKYDKSLSGPEAEKATSVEDIQKSKRYYRCYICSQYFILRKFYLTHLANKHNVSKSIQEMENEEFDAVCKFCFRSYSTVQSYNIHLLKVHKEHIHTQIGEEKSNDQKRISKTATMAEEEKIVKNDKTKIDCLVLKSALFKCLKCDIHFVSSKISRNHTEHMEKLINWKCLVCNRIFKKEDKFLHEKQHEHSEEFSVYELCPVTSSPVLYNCSKCTVHFDEEQFLKHYSVCERSAPNSVFCIICDILIDNSISKEHRSEHVSKNLRPTDFVIVNSDILAIFERQEHPKKPKNEEHCNISEKRNMSVKRKIKESSNIPQKRDKPFDAMLNFTYCNTCKCFVTDTCKREIHIEKRCQQLAKYICNECGLILTTQSYKTGHKNIHNTVKDIKLQDFRFYDIDSGKSICPPTPEYPKCENCDVHFISQDAILSHECSEIDYLTCHLCNINLTEDAFKLHMLFHNYSNANIEANTSKSTSRDNSIQPNKQVINKIDKQLMCTKKENRKNSRKPNITNVSHSNRVRKISIERVIRKSDKQNFKAKLKEKICDNSYASTPKVLNNNLIEVKPQSSETQHKQVNSLSIEEEVNLKGVVYQCKNCLISIDSYDKVIEHCQAHYCNEESNIETVLCNICNLTFDAACFENHHNLHLLHKIEDFTTILNFDTVYFTSENRVWVHHLFGTLSELQRDKILNESIYKYECRIKMEVIQNGPTGLTVYKCDKCRTFIDETTLYKHAENSCFKLRKHPCTVCGLPFNASVSRIKHEKIHANPNITCKTFRIVTFNKEEDKAFNKLIYCRSQYYVLYQCRNCTVSVDKSQSKNHKCCRRNLKTCASCGLLFVNDDYDVHILRHKELSNFIQKNIKVILFGEKENVVGDINKIVSSFTGIVYDYTFYSCSICQLCVKPDANLDKHTCYFGANRLKCSNCKLYFLTNKLKHHMKLHETDPDFIRENIRVIIFNFSKDLLTTPDQSENVEQHTENDTITKDETLISDKALHNDNNRSVDIQSQNADDTTRENNFKEKKNANIYKCICGLHFLDHTSMLSHIKNCDHKTKVAKQKCAKCDLLFTPDILFNHLIMHHGNKLQVYEFNIIDIAKNNIIYKCYKCYLHFAQIGEINEHFKFCDGTAEGKDCIFCNLKFESVSFISHDCSNVNNVNANVAVIELEEPLITKIVFETKNMKILNMKESMAVEHNKLEEMSNQQLNQPDNEQISNEDSDIRNMTSIIENKQEESHTDAIEQCVSYNRKATQDEIKMGCGETIPICDSTSSLPDSSKQTWHWRSKKKWQKHFQQPYQQQQHQQPYRQQQHFQRPYRQQQHFQRPYRHQQNSHRPYQHCQRFQQSYALQPPQYQFNHPNINMTRMPHPNPYYQ